MVAESVNIIKLTSGPADKAFDKEKSPYDELEMIFISLLKTRSIGKNDGDILVQTFILVLSNNFSQPTNGISSPESIQVKEFRSPVCGPALLSMSPSFHGRIGR